MNRTNISPWMIIDHLGTAEYIAAYLRAAAKEAGDDPAFLVVAVTTAATALERLGNPATQKRPCPSCGGTMTRGIRPQTITLRGHSLTYDQPGWHCHDCDDGIIADADNEAGDAALRRLKEMAAGA